MNDFWEDFFYDLDSNSSREQVTSWANKTLMQIFQEVLDEIEDLEIKNAKKILNDNIEFFKND